MAEQALCLRKIPHGGSATIEAGVWLEGQLRRRRCNSRDGAAAYAAMPSSGQTSCGATS